MSTCRRPTSWGELRAISSALRSLSGGLPERRHPGHAKIRIYNPDPTTDGWSSPHTIVEIVNDDMPFLVDSVSLAINASGRTVHLVIHPILSVMRDPKGRLGVISRRRKRRAARILDADRDHP